MLEDLIHKEKYVQESYYQIHVKYIRKTLLFQNRASIIDKTIILTNNPW